jgi:hypothetical protein
LLGSVGHGLPLWEMRKKMMGKTRPLTTKCTGQRRIVGESQNQRIKRSKKVTCEGKSSHAARESSCRASPTAAVLPSLGRKCRALAARPRSGSWTPVRNPDGRAGVQASSAGGPSPGLC